MIQRLRMALGRFYPRMLTDQEAANLVKSLDHLEFRYPMRRIMRADPRCERAFWEQRSAQLDRSYANTREAYREAYEEAGLEHPEPPNPNWYVPAEQRTMPAPTVP